MELQRQGARLRLFSIRDTRAENVRHFPAELLDQVTFLPPPDRLADEVKALKEAGKLPSRLVLTLRHWGDRPDKSRVIEAAWIGEKLRQDGIGHVHTHFAGLGARTCWWIRQFYGLSYSFTGHANDLFVPDDHTPLKLPRLVADASCVIAVSDFTARWLRERHPASAGRIHRVYNGLDLEPVISGSRDAAKDSPPLILSVGRLIEKKGFDDLIRACALLRARGQEFSCVIVGDGPLRGDLEAQIAAAGLTDAVSLAGARAQSEIITLLGKSALFALPCVTEKDGGMDVLPTVLMEAMAAGLPCVSTRLAGVPEMVEHDATGLLTAERRPEEFSAALAALLADPSRAARLGAAGLALARRRFSKEVTGAHLLRLLRANGKTRPANLAQLFRRLTPALRAPRHPKNQPVMP